MLDTGDKSLNERSTCSRSLHSNGKKSMIITAPGGGKCYNNNAGEGD